MRQYSPLHFLNCLLLTCCALSLAGCAGLWGERRDRMSASLQTVQDDLTYTQLQITETQKALEELAVAPVADLPEAYQSLRGEVNKMTGAGARLVRHAEGMHYRGGSYLVESESSATQCQYPRLSANAGTRALELGEAFGPIAEQSKEVQRAYRAFEFDIASINDYLFNHLTPQGIDIMQLFFRKAEVDGESLSLALDRARAAVQEAKAAQSEATPGEATTQ